MCFRSSHNRLISESSSSSSSESETQSSVDTDLSSAVSKSLRSLRKRSRGCTPASTTQRGAQPAASSSAVHSIRNCKPSQQPSISSSTVIGSSISSRLRPRTSTARPAVDSSADRLSPATTNSSAPQSRNRSPLSQNLPFDITEIGEATLVFGNRVDTPESPDNCHITEEYYHQLVDSPIEDQRYGSTMFNLVFKYLSYAWYINFHKLTLGFPTGCRKYHLVAETRRNANRR